MEKQHKPKKDIGHITGKIVMRGKFWGFSEQSVWLYASEKEY